MNKKGLKVKGCSTSSMLGQSLFYFWPPFNSGDAFDTARNLIKGRNHQTKVNRYTVSNFLRVTITRGGRTPLHDLCSSGH